MTSDFAAAHRVRVLYVHNSADIYGASRSLLRLLPEMQRRGYVPQVVLPQDGPLEPHLRELGVSVTVDPSLAVIDRALVKSPRLLLFFLRFPISVLRLRRLIARERISLVHTNTGVMPAPALAARLAGVPHIWHIRDSFLEFRALWKGYRRYIIGLSDQIIAVSRPIAAQFEDAQNVTVIHNGIPLNEFPESPNEIGEHFRQTHGLGAGPVVGCVGRIKLVRKGQEVLLQAAALLKKRRVRAKYLIVGAPWPGNEAHLERLRQIIAELHLEEDVVFTGELADVKPAYAAMDVFVLPSVQPEPFGGVVLEAMAMRRPVIATAIGGSIDQVVDGQTGFLVTPGDPEALADKLALLIQDAALRQRMGAAGRERLVQCFSVDSMANKIEHVYLTVLKKS